MQRFERSELYRLLRGCQLGLQPSACRLGHRIDARGQWKRIHRTYGSDYGPGQSRRLGRERQCDGYRRRDHWNHLGFRRLGLHHASGRNQRSIGHRRNGNGGHWRHFDGWYQEVHRSAHRPQDSYRYSRHDHLSWFRLLRNCVSAIWQAAEFQPACADNPAGLCTGANRQRRLCKRQCGEREISGSRHFGSEESSRARKVHQLPTRRGKRRQPVPSCGLDVHGRRGFLHRKPRYSAPSRRCYSMDQRRHATPMDNACRRQSERRQCGHRP